MRLGGLRVVIYPNDHAPSHVHVVGAEGEAVFILLSPSAGVELRETFGFSRVQVRRIAEELAPHVAELQRAWRRIHGLD